MVSDEEPVSFAADENVRGLYDRFVETLGKGGGDARGAGDPADISFDAHPQAAQRDAHALRILEDSRPAFAHFVPAEK